MHRFFFAFVLALLCTATGAQRLVLPGDHPDPSVVRIGNTFWASATTSNWMPAYPLLRSDDLVHWTAAGNVFNTLPAWADYYFWAPELSYDGGRVYIYYAAHRRDGNLCLGIASADRPEGPYKDHGPLICQEAGSIDAFPIRDEEGKLQLIWKEDGNSVKKPTPIWMQELNEGRTALVGEKRELFRNDASWEGNLVEGVSMIRHGDYFYAFYAASGCCGAGCNYTTGVARARKLAGPWEKFQGNPVLSNGGGWKCPGHGTPIEKDGRFYFLYHAYDSASGIYTGRQGLLREFAFTPEGWVRFFNDAPEASKPLVPAIDEFRGNHLGQAWQWSVYQNAGLRQRHGRLELNALPAAGGAYVGQMTLAADYDAIVEVDRRRSGAAAGIGLIGDEQNSISARFTGDSVQVIQLRGGKETVLTTRPAGRGKKGYLRIQVRGGGQVRLALGDGNGAFTALHPDAIAGAYLPPWDRALRVGLMARGAVGEKAVFERFELLPPGTE